MKAAGSFLMFAFLIFLFNGGTQAQSLKVNRLDFITPGEIWPDLDGNHIQAHGGGILKIDNTFYWYGEQRGKGLDRHYRYVSCYSSCDLMNWKFRGNVLKMTAPDSLSSSWVLERPKVFYNIKTKKYIMYFHVDRPDKQSYSYKLAEVGIATCDEPYGEFSYVRRFRPLNHESRDIGQFIDDDCSAYLIFEDRPNGFHIAKLSDDYMDIEKDIALIPAHLEGGAIVHCKGLYYCIGSRLTGWSPNPNKYATALALEGPWSEFKDIAPPEKNTYGSQSTMLIKVTGTKTTSVIFMGDIWNPQSQFDSRYLWMPLEISDGRLMLPSPKPWSINVETGEIKIKDN
jgi:hypothetical protein